jgi:hypothetical protein
LFQLFLVCATAIFGFSWYFFWFGSDSCKVFGSSVFGLGLLPFVFSVVVSGLGDFVDRLNCELPLLVILSAA